MLTPQRARRFELRRADDLRLGQPVALKFVSHRAGEERRLYDEVRIGRQVSHPNVCRLHDIAEVNKQLFITMEFVDGEDPADCASSRSSERFSPALTLGAGTWLAYVAIEPLVRRRWPRILIGWRRMLGGQFRDPMIGRDLLIGSIAGIVLELMQTINSLMPGASPVSIAPSSFGYLSDTAHYLLRNAFSAAFLPLLMLTILLACFVVTRNLKATLIVGGMIMAAGSLDAFQGPQWIRIPSAIFAPCSRSR